MNANNFEERLQSYAGAFHPVVPFEAGRDKLLRMDFTAANKQLSLEVLQDTGLFSQYITNELQHAGATYGIGGYNEHRTIYQRSHVFDAAPSGSPQGGVTQAPAPLNADAAHNADILQSRPGAEAESPLGGDLGGLEPRRLHLGIDIWGPAGTPVYAPLEGTVHSFAFNDAYGDYGATLILQHEIDGLIFHTLYGHLSLHSIEDKKEGQDISKGNWIAAFGEPAENGQWPPHLHFQIILDMKGKKGDYPGVCKFSERESYLANGPDPDLLLGMMKMANHK